ncbi:MAG TPA: DUF4214 domain-containing protein [Usitatibacter sp.]|nr:DUF4214 domain-containing protein [Usitatibacter sp.]
MPTARSSAAAAVVSGRIYVLGGYQGGVACQYLSTNQAYDAAANTWSNKAAMPWGPDGAGAASINGIVYAVGGLTNCGSSFATLGAYDPALDSWTIKAPMPTARGRLGVAAVGGRLYAIGGGLGNAVTNKVEAYDPATNSWSSRASMPTARMWFATAEAGGLVYVFGGWSGSATLATVEAYDPATDTWSSKASMPTARVGAAAGVRNGLIYVVGGEYTSPPTTLVEVFDPSTNAWATGPSMMVPRGTAGTATIDGELHVFGGSQLGGGVLASVEALTPTTTFPLSVTRSGSGNGSVSSSPAGISCGSTCSASFAASTSVTLSASPDSSSSFAGWGGACSGTGACNVTMSAARSVAATFTLNTLASTTTLASTPNPSVVGQAATFTATVQGSGGTPTGTVTIKEAQVARCGPLTLVAGSAGCSLPDLSAGMHTFTAEYSGSGTFLPSNSTFHTHTVQSAASVPGLVLDRSAIDFGAQSMGTTSPVRTVTLTNNGSGPLVVSGVATSSPQFTVAHGCATLQPGGACSLQLAFSPAVAGGALNSTAAVAGTLSIASNAPGSPHSVALAGNAEKSLVTHYYRAILNRDPDAAGKDYWESEAARLLALGVDVNETWYVMAGYFFNSTEYLAANKTDAQFVTDLYNTFFNRAPDTGGLNFWAAQIAAGLPREVVLFSFMFSGEFRTFTQAIFGVPNVRPEMNMVVDFFRGLLNRLPDTPSLQFWLERLRIAQCQGAGPVYTAVDEISAGFMFNPEYDNRRRTNTQFVTDMYYSFLRRGGDISGVQFWINELNSGARFRNDVRALGFLNSTEFGARVQAVIAAGCVPGFETPAIASLSKMEANPLAPLVLTVSGINVSARTSVRFFDGAGYDVEVPALVKSATEVRAAVPPYHALDVFRQGNVSVQLVQQTAGGRKASAPMSGLVVRAPPTVAGANGTLTAQLAMLADVIAPDTRSRLQLLEGRYSGAPSTAAQRNASTPLQSASNALAQSMLSSATGTAASWGNVGGRALVLDATTRAVLDSLAEATFLALGPNSPSPCEPKDLFKPVVIDPGDIIEGRNLQARQYGGGMIPCAAGEVLDAGEKMSLAAGAAAAVAAAAGAALSIPVVATGIFIPLAVGSVVIMMHAEARGLSDSSRVDADNLKRSMEMMQAPLQNAIDTVRGLIAPTTSQAYEWLGYARGAWEQASPYVGQFDLDLAFAQPPVAPPQYLLTLTKSGTGQGSVGATPAGPSHASGTKVTVTAAPSAGSTFAGWSGACAGMGGCSVVMNASLGVNARFDPVTVTCTYTVTPATISPQATASTVIVTVQTPATCPWSIQSDADWVSYSGPANRVGPGEVSVNVLANMGTGRTGTITIAGQPVSVQQPTRTFPGCNFNTCNQVCLDAYVACNNACPGQGSVLLNCVNACQRTWNACPAYTNTTTCTCHMTLQ